MSGKSDFLKAIHFDHPERIPIKCSINGACWNAYPAEALQELMARHPVLFPNAEAAPPRKPRFEGNASAREPFVDAWGCTWETPEDGLTGCVTGHPLDDWSALETYQPPDPETTDGVRPVDWNARELHARRCRETDTPFGGSLTHGHTFLRLLYIRGYENLLFDMADNRSELWTLIDIVEAFNTETVTRFLDLGVSWMGYPEDLGMQVGPMLSPTDFRTYIKPSFQRLMGLARDAGAAVHMHSDGDIRALLDDLIDGGVECINLQDLVNGVDWIRDRLKGKVCIDLDIDRQNITCFGNPGKIDELVKYEVATLGAPEGGLMLTYGFYPGTPIENADAVMSAMERYSLMFA
jgi:hypothetical protein